MRSIRLGLAMAAAVVATPVLGSSVGAEPYDPATTESEQAAAQAEDTAASTQQETATAGDEAAAPREGAGGMEPGDAQATPETREQRDEREFVNEVWNSP